MNQFPLGFSWGLLVLIPLVSYVQPVVGLEVSRLVPLSVVAQATSPEAIAESFINQMAQQQFSAAVQEIAPPLQVGVTSQTLRQNWNDLVAESGEFQQIGRSQLISDGGAEGETVVMVTVQFAERNRDLFVILKGNEVASFSAAE